MSRQLSPIKQVQKDTRALLKLWRAVVKRYTDLLNDKDIEVSASTMQAINSFLTANSCTLDQFLNLSALERLREIDSKVSGIEGEVLRLEGPKIVDQNTIDEKQLEEDLTDLPLDDEYDEDREYAYQ